MRTVRRAIRALIRSPLRGALMVGVLAVTIGLALIMITVNGAFAERLDQVRAQVGTDITVRPAGSFGGGAFGFRIGGGGGNGPGGVVATPTPAPDDSSTAAAPTITDEDLRGLTSIPHVVSITRVITARYSGSNLKAAEIEPPPGAQIIGAPAQGFSPPIIVTGTDDPNTLASLGVTDVTLSSGRSFTADDEGANVAVIGEALATANNLSVGSTFDLDQTDETTGESTTTTMTVIGIYTTGTSFGDNSMALPIDTARTIFGRSNEVDQAIVKADSIDNVEQVSNDIKSTLGTDKADVTTAQSLFSTISAPLSDAKNSSEIGMIVALIASAAIILFSIGLVARQRIREIGIMKAVGASAWNVVSQFALETGVIAVAAAVIGAIATFPLAQTVANGLVSDPTTPTFGGPGGRGGGAGGQFFISASNAATNGANSLFGNVDVAVSPQIFLYALLIAVVLAVIATTVPVWYVGRVRPAEVLRHE